MPKLVQAAAVILKTAHGHRMSYLRVLKLLYVAQRESLKERGVFIFGDRTVAMEHGPVLSETYNLIKGEHILADEWDRFIRTDRYDLVLETPPGLSELSRWEVEKLHEVVSRFADLGDYELVRHLHDILEEWNRDPVLKGRQRPIPLHDILSAVGQRATESEIVAEHDAHAEFLERLKGIQEDSR